MSPLEKVICEKTRASQILLKGVKGGKRHFFKWTHNCFCSVLPYIIWVAKRPLSDARRHHYKCSFNLLFSQIGL